MTFKSILFFLFLYVCLVWVGAAYLYSGPKIEEVGLLWTAAGLTALLVFLIVSRLWGWWRVMRAKNAARPKPVVKPAPPINEEDAALAALIAEASASLNKHAVSANKQGERRLSSLPLYLLIGLEGSGKTSTFVNSGLDPHLLAGQGPGTGLLTSTQVCNFWLAEEALFVEIGGRLFSGDPERWRRSLELLRAKPPVPLWRRLWSEPVHELALHGVLAFCDVKEFTPTRTPQGQEQLERRGREWQQRLAAVAEVFGVEFPVYVVIAKADAIPYFPDYFRRLPEPESGQVFGCTLPFGEIDRKQSGEVFGDVATKRLTRSFNPLYHSLAERRLLHLAHEPDPTRRASIYEFPREVRRIRSSLVQFLVGAFRPHPLRAGAFLRGYYLTGVREGEVAAPAASGPQLSAKNVGLEATGLFRADATQIFRGDLSATATPAGVGGLRRKWIFVSELLHSVVLSDRAARITAAAEEPRLELYRRGACALVCLLCLVFCGIFFRSWAGNLELLNTVARTADIPRATRTATLTELQSLDDLRDQVSRLAIYGRDGAPWSLRWGLYSGNRVGTAARQLYFVRFQDLLLNNLNAAIIGRLDAVPTSPDSNAPYEPVARLLKAHLMISSGVCKPEPAFASTVLKETLRETMPAVGSEGQAVADRQVDFYTSELPYGNPVSVPEDTAARDRARQYLRRVQGLDRIYSRILAAAAQTLSKPQRLGDLAPNYREVLNGPGEVSDVFSREGWDYVDKASKNRNADSLGEPCVVGEGGGIDRGLMQNTEVERSLKRMFIHDYIEHWRNFVMGFSVLRYSSPEDAARKLEVLSDHRSPLLALLAMTSNQTSFQSVTVEPEGLERVKPLINKVLPSFSKAEKAAPLAARTKGLSSPADINRSFQPVHWVVPAGGDTWVVDKNSAYIDSLAELQRSMREIARTASNPDPAVHQAASQNYEKALDAVRQIARGFEPVGTEGLDAVVQRLLESSIRPAQNFIIADLGKAAKDKVNGELRAMCARLGSTLRKYPFQSSGPDVSLEELASWFAPSEGGIWKFEAQSLGEFVVKDGFRWKSKDPAKQVTPEMLDFLNRSEAIADAFYPAGATQPQLTYTLRPKLDASFRDAVLELEVDGQVHQWTSSLQKQFTWPAGAGSSDAGAIGRIRTGSVSFPFASRGGIWGIFRIMGDAEPRPLASKVVEWKYVRGGDGRLEAIQPAPVRLEIVEFPAGVDLFNPTFFEGLHCPAKAVP